ncbi:Deoxyhypusine synthase [Nosema bombycis CQ1]|uniref:deoxyhypusine synthase n=1 Tax=Nosema bombycis (strain CQ1 / CVCC 102059) TaxID=578461 RepID=R0KMN1_NOSB1|nr:Deoxyhypusine synthase [Nosema bombycis CQ1]|eukprot:EOB11896.1 Deoxyhypusine synthase [Nosema bombycis CQ1]
MSKIPQNVNDLCKKTKDDLNFNVKVKGIDFNKDNITLDDIINSYATTGFQALNLHKAIQEINRMKNAKIFFGCTSNLVSSGLREVIRYLVEHKFIHVCVITGGGIEEDLIKTLASTYCADFTLKGDELRENGFNRIGNLVIPSENYELYQKWFTNLLDKLTENYTEESPLILTPSKFIKILGENINDESSILYWAYKNSIPIYSPAITDGSIGDLFSFYHKRKCIKLDIVEDIRNINFESLGDQENGAIILGSGLIKHHILNANLFNDGLDYCVLINTSAEFDGSDSGATLEESVSWGKVKPNRSCVKVFADATIVFPLIVYATFKKNK